MPILLQRLAPAAACLALAACASQPDQPTLGERLRVSGGELSQLGENWVAADLAIAEGEELIEEGREEIEEGEERVDDAERDLRRGRDEIEEGEEMVRRGERLIRQGRSTKREVESAAERAGVDVPASS